MRKIHGIVLLMISLFGTSSDTHALAVGDKAPELAVRNQDGVEVNLAEFYTKGPTLVYFYPKSGTPGCTAQACSLRDAFPDFSADGLQVIGVSADSVESQKKFAEDYKLPFTLVADTDLAVTKAFGVPTVPLLGVPKRQSFIVKDGRVAWIVESAKTGEHAAEVKHALAALGIGKNP